jgi:hypothetical protein
VQAVRLSGVGDGGDGDAQDADAVDALVLVGLPGEQAHARDLAVQLRRQLAFGRYETAWMILHKLRRAMVAPGREPLTGEVEVDEGYIGGRDADLRGGRQRDGKPLIGVAVEVRGRSSLPTAGRATTGCPRRASISDRARNEHVIAMAVSCCHVRIGRSPI